ncbi:unnamed protein product [Cuscuta epithymum]|uniref:X8 domain-containing protein n=1 Tax=Cuscuta epithymum TaxID=186058 RepID=A0AAV0G5K3_9ASTE|nr:unnamed protein product [Cuscuta epithymum]
MFRMSQWRLLIFVQFISLLICSEGKISSIQRNIFSSSTTPTSKPPPPLEAATSTISPASPTLSTNWCIAGENASPDDLQRALDFACNTNKTGVNCADIQPGGNCFIPNTLKNHASYAMNLYHQINHNLSDSCNFGGVGFITTVDPTESLVTTTPITQNSLNASQNATRLPCRYLPTSTSASGFNNTSLSGTFGGTIGSGPNRAPSSYSSTASARISCLQMCYSMMLAFLMIICLARG